MAIALDAVTNNNNTTGTSLTYSHTNGSGSIECCLLDVALSVGTIAPELLMDEFQWCK